MSFREFVEEAKLLTSAALQSLNFEAPKELEWDEPPNSSLGDLSLRVGYQLAKKEGKRPAEIVFLIATKIRDQFWDQRKLVALVEGHPSGFLNFRIDPSAFTASVLKSAAKEGYGAVDMGKGRSVIVEHTAVNPNKALHVGHLRNVALGDSIARIFLFTGHKVAVANYIDDSGLQVADVLVGFLNLGYPKEAPPGVKYDHYAGDTIYVNVTKEYETNPNLKKEQKKVLKGLEERDPAIFPLAFEITERILREQLLTCWRLGAYYDLLVYESDIVQSRLWSSIFSQMQAKGITRRETQGKFEGCWIVTIPGEKEGEEKVLVRADGTATYVAKDIPFAALKVGAIPDLFGYVPFALQPNGKQLWRTVVDRNPSGRSPIPWGANESITVIDTRQARLQRIIRHILEELVGEKLEQKYVHLEYAIISLSERTAASLLGGKEGEKSGIVTMSGRHGTYINADNVLDSLKLKALEETRKRNPEISDEAWLDRVAETLAIGAIRFSLLKQDLDKLIVFDLEGALRLVGETGPYMLYTFARGSSILAKIGDGAKQSDYRAELLHSEIELELIKLLSKFDLSVEKAVKFLAPKWLAHYSFELCECFNKFYEKNRVLQEPDAEVRKARLELVRAFLSVLATSLGLLGIPTLERI